jgi:predicted nucleotidyltransferase
MTIAEVIRETVPVEKIYLFGSYAYGEPHKNSDLDFYVVVPDNSDHPIEIRQKIRDSIRRVIKQTQVDLITTRSSRFADLSVLPSMENRIAREGVLLYEQGRPGERLVS